MCLGLVPLPDLLTIEVILSTYLWESYKSPEDQTSVRPSLYGNVDLPFISFVFLSLQIHIGQNTTQRDIKNTSVKYTGGSVEPKTSAMDVTCAQRSVWTTGLKVEPPLPSSVTSFDSCGERTRSGKRSRRAEEQLLHLAQTQDFIMLGYLKRPSSQPKGAPLGFALYSLHYSAS